MSDNKKLTFSKGEHPEIEGLKTDESVKFSGEATVKEGEDDITIEFQDLNFETEGLADRELRGLKGEEKTNSSSQSVAGGEF